MSKKISVALSTSSIGQAIKELEKYKRELIRKENLLRERIAEFLAYEIQTGFDGAIRADLIEGTAKKPNVNVSIGTKGGVTVVIAQGEDAVFIEFGAGVYHNGSVGSSPHPKGSKLGFTIGSYGQGKGKRKAWGYYEDGELKITHGTPAQMPMAKAVNKLCLEFPSMAKEVFR